LLRIRVNERVITCAGLIAYDLTLPTPPTLIPVMDLPPFQTLLDSHSSDVYLFLNTVVGRDAAEDCYQETWISALRAYPRLRSAENLRAWLLTIARRKAIDQIRALQRAPIPAAELPEVAHADPEPADFDGSLWPVVRSLPTKQRIAVGLRYALDADYRSIAGAMGVSEEAARRNVHEGLKRLRKEYRHD